MSVFPIKGELHIFGEGLVRRLSFAIAGVALLCSCGPSPEEEAARKKAALEAYKAAEQQRYLAEREKMKPILAAIDYPSCDQLWNGEKLSKCGEGVYRAALSACQAIALKKLPGGIALIDEYTGDSWQMRAGPAAARSVDARVPAVYKTDIWSETFAYALGNGTDQIEKFMCYLNEDMKLEDVVE